MTFQSVIAMKIEANSWPGSTGLGIGKHPKFSGNLNARHIVGIPIICMLIIRMLIICGQIIISHHGRIR